MNFGKLGNQLMNFADKAVKKGEDAVEITRLNMNISTMQSQCDDVYKKMGAIIYKNIVNGADYGEELKELSSSIATIINEIDQVRAEIDKLKATDNSIYTNQ